MVAPPTAWATKAESHSRDVLWPEFYDHSLRTWCFGLALAQADGVALDEEIFYVAAMLHDIGLRKPIADRCFTYAGAEAAESTAPPHTPRDGIEQVKTAILAHIDIRVPKDPHGRAAYARRPGCLLLATHLNPLR